MRVLAPKFYFSAPTGPGDVICYRKVGELTSLVDGTVAQGGIVLLPLLYWCSEGKAPSHHVFIYAGMHSTNICTPPMSDSGLDAGRTL